jgi:hypothetical protein
LSPLPKLVFTLNCYSLLVHFLSSTSPTSTTYTTSTSIFISTTTPQIQPI